MKKIVFCFLVSAFWSQCFAQPEIWGTVSNGGYNGNFGYIFKTDSIGDSLIVVHSFDSIHGFNPGALLAAGNNKLYGLTTSGGEHGGLFNGGVFYEYDLSTSTFTVIESFGTGNTHITGYRPDGDGFRTLTEVAPGIIYGYIRGAYQGSVVFEYNANTQTLQSIINLPTYMGGASNQTQGNRLTGNLFKAPDGYLYGSTYTNSTCPIPNPQMGSIVRIDPVTHIFSIQYLATCQANLGGVLLNNHFAEYNNELYSTAREGGTSGNGIIYSFNPSTNIFTKRYDFAGGTGGRYPQPMVEAVNGKFYGLADGGLVEPSVPQGSGIIYEFDPATNITTQKYDFSYGNGWSMNVGPFPFSLIDGHNGKLYGITPGNGVFEYDPVQNSLRAAGRMPTNVVWYTAATPSLTYVCRKPSYTPVNDTVYVCNGDDLTIQLGSDNTDSYTWIQNNTPFSTDTSGTLSLSNVTTADAGTWVCEMTNVCGITISHPVQVIVAGGNMSVSQNADFLQSSPADSYQWINCDNDNSPLAGQTNPTFTPTGNGNYAVIGYSALCADTSACFTFNNLGTETYSNNNLLLYPNPATNSIQINTDLVTEIQVIFVTNLAGQVVLTTVQKQMDISALKAGEYFVHVLTKNTEYHGCFIKAN